MLRSTSPAAENYQRPDNVNLRMWLKNQEIRIEKGTMPPQRHAELEAIPTWFPRMASRENTMTISETDVN